jgi:hypothetical protein
MRFIFVFVLLFVCSGVRAQGTRPIADADTVSVDVDAEKNQPKLSADSTHINRRSFDESALHELQKNEDLDYKQPPTIVESLWDRFISWLFGIFSWLFRGAVSTDWGRMALYAIGLIILVVLTMMLLKVDALRVFQSGADKGALGYGTFNENIHEMDFDKLIRDAIGKKEYRLGVRLTFLHALKMLSDRQHVDWRPGKTNHDYLAELKEGELKTGFNELSFYFDYTWYGDFNVTENLFQRVNSIFDGWRRKIE